MNKIFIITGANRGLGKAFVDLLIKNEDHFVISISRSASDGIPTLHFLVVDNQAVSEKWKETGFTYFIGWYNKPILMDDILKGIDDLRSKEVRAKMSISGQRFVDGLGARRLVKELRTNL